MKKILDWNDIVKLKPKKYLTKEEYEIYKKAEAYFDNMVSDTPPKKIKLFIESGGLNIHAMQFAKLNSNPHTNPNLYKAIYKIVTNYPYKY